MAAVGMMALLVSPAAAQSPSPTPTPKPGGVPTIGSAEAILVNLTEDSQILFTRNATISRAPASLTKLVTALVAQDEYDMDEIVTTDQHVLQTGGSDLGLEPGMKISVRDLLYALLLKSANDSAMALAAYHPAGYEHFIRLMNQKARALGAYDSQFRNPHGLDMDGHYSSARDMAIFGRDVLREPALAEIVDTGEHTMIWKGRERPYGHHHRLVRDVPEVIGLKTGFTNNAGHSLISAERTPAGTFLTVVMGSPDQYGETLALFRYGRYWSTRGAGGGGVDGFGFLPGPPKAPETALPSLTLDASDPRDDIRWAILMMALALICAAMLVTARRQQTAGGITAGEAWLAKIIEDERRRRR